MISFWEYLYISKRIKQYFKDLKEFNTKSGYLKTLTLKKGLLEKKPVYNLSCTINISSK